ncbi:hypothetical protein NUJ28_14655 [Burkholderia multivorans]|uniref:hypothetical protein n=1 Tax=Burkholderia multivorans TaxID=87883 RepID=UPI0021D9D221|nr:hypothetical protein [Burkholderia multivorans]UXZ60727.1 hypothetical protein NUJ28_14655 [Burkholderia multivorans]HDR8988294.1 hypothetical protein [Burkholderia vietnamiensis]HDR9047288.1 hypothetical protein [Burkholderia vietnamiensis]HDR9233466.1 hypothetical protein [Burkholderia vietnamiensis]
MKKSSFTKIALSSILATMAVAVSGTALAAEDRNDFPTESNKCTNAWDAAFHKSNGADAPISYDQEWEFVDNCRAGKYPPGFKKKKQ